MSNTLKQRLQLIKQQADIRILTQMNFGIERETLRVNTNATLANTSHPIGLGNSLTHPHITTDYSEALLEFITPVHQNITDLFNFLQTLHTITANELNNELMWAGSMPAKLGLDDSIPIAYYGQSNLGQLKKTYRKGLAVRYGKAMQTIAGLHYNVSFPTQLWELLNAHENPDQPLANFQSDQYLGLIRNFRRYYWLLMYLFGASPCVDKSFFQNNLPRKSLESLDADTYYSPYATSLRMSDMGYNNVAQASLHICYNNLSQYIESLSKAIHSPYEPYEKIGIKQNGQYIQLNANLLQIENEYYNNIRPKRNAYDAQSPLAALKQNGIEYVEIRCMDINPFEPLGISKDAAYFLNIFLTYCALKESPYMQEMEECKRVTYNATQVIDYGRAPNLQLQLKNGATNLIDWGQLVLDDLLPIAELFDQAQDTNAFTNSLETQRAKLLDADKTPSAQFLNRLTSHQESYQEGTLKLSKKHHDFFKNQAIDAKNKTYFTDVAKKSIEKEQKLRQNDKVDFDTYLKNFNQRSV